MGVWACRCRNTRRLRTKQARNLRPGRLPQRLRPNPTGHLGPRLACRGRLLGESSNRRLYCSLTKGVIPQVCGQRSQNFLERQVVGLPPFPPVVGLMSPKHCKCGQPQGVAHTTLDQLQIQSHKKAQHLEQCGMWERSERESENHNSVEHTQPRAQLHFDHNYTFGGSLRILLAK